VLHPRPPRRCGQAKGAPQVRQLVWASDQAGWMFRHCRSVGELTIECHLLPSTLPGLYPRRSRRLAMEVSIAPEGETLLVNSWAVSQYANEDSPVMLLIDAANVVGSRPNGWWRDRPGAARAFVERVRAAVGSGLLAGPVVVVLEGAARGGVEPGSADGVTVIHASASGDDALIAVAAEADSQVKLVSADRALCQRAEDLGADVARPGWLIGLLDK